MSIHTDGIAVSDEQEGLFLTLYHLRMAALYFETCPDPIPDDVADGDFSSSAMDAWFAAMEALYPGDE